MPIDIREFLELGDPDKQTQKGSSGQKNGADDGAGGSEDSAEAGKWRSLFQPIPESGGPFGGRNPALCVLIGYLRAKSFPYEAGYFFAQQWNQQYCDPPIDPVE